MRERKRESVKAQVHQGGKKSQGGAERDDGYSERKMEAVTA